MPVCGERRFADALGNKKYSNRIIKAGALLPDTKLLLETWDTDTEVENNLERIREEIILKEARPTVVADLGQGVLDTAMVKAAAFALEKSR